MQDRIKLEPRNELMNKAVPLDRAASWSQAGLCCPLRLVRAPFAESYVPRFWTRQSKASETLHSYP